jgi:hypothetical protein
MRSRISCSLFYWRVIAEHQIEPFVGVPLGGMSALVYSRRSRFEFKDGTIEVEMAGEPKENAESGAPRGFVGMAFRLNTDATNVPRYEGFYLRPTNGRTEDQVRRNHATQYISYPDRPWFELRKDFPGKYESYADMVAGEWIKMRIEVHGKKANLFLDDAPQPVLVVTDLTQEHGRIALWVGTDTVAHFANPRVTPSN